VVGTFVGPLDHPHHLEFCLFHGRISAVYGCAELPREAYPKYLAPVFAENDLARSLFGAAFSLFANAMYAR
jgi:hypothetical protein